MSNLLKSFASFYTQRIFINSFVNNARINIKFRQLRFYSDSNRINLPYSRSSSKQFKNLPEAVNALFTSSKSGTEFSTVQLTQFEQLLSEAPKPLDMVSFSKCLYSFRIYKSVDVNKIILNLARQCSKLKQSFGSQAVGNTLYGLQNMSCDSSEVRALLKELTKKIAECTEPLRAQHVGNSLYGLQNMTSDSSEVRALLKELTKKIAECAEPLREQAVGNSLNGLQNMNSDSSEARALLKVLTKKIAECIEPLEAQHVGNAFYGIQWSNIDMDLLPFVIRCFNQISEYERDCSFDDICTLYQSFTLLDENSNFTCSLKDFSLYEKFLEQKKRFLDLLNNHDKKGALEGLAMSKSEEKYFTLAKGVLSDSYPELTFSSNEFLYGFEVDIIVRKQITNQTPRILVIEVDGPSHRSDLTSKGFDKLRDAHLAKEYGIIVERWELVVTDKLKSEGIIKKFRESFDRFVKQ